MQHNVYSLAVPECGWVRMRNERAKSEKRARYERQPEEKMTWVDLKLLHWGVKLPVRATTRDLYRAHVHFSYEELFCCFFFCPLTNDLHSFIHISLVEISVLFSASAQPLTHNTYEHFSYIRSYVWAVRRLIKLFYFSSSLEVLSLFFLLTDHCLCKLEPDDECTVRTAQWGRRVASEIINNIIH